MRKLRKLQLHLTAREPSLVPALRSLLERELEGLPPEVEGRLVVSGREARESAFAERLGAVGPVLFDASFDLSMSTDVGDSALLELAGALRDPLAELVDGKGSAVLLGDEIEFTPGDGTFQLSRLLRRRPDLTLGRFSLHWATLHGELGRQGMGPTPYRQLHRDPEPTAEAARIVGVEIDDFDGNAIVVYPDAEGTPAAAPPPGHAEKLYADGLRFVDRSRSVFGFGRVVAPVA